MKAFILGTLAALTAAMTREQAEITREAMVKYAAPQFTVIVDGVQTPTYAFTDGERKHTYIDYKRFNHAPNSLKNVIRHEIDHLRGRDHNAVAGDIMAYHLTVAPNGTVLDDAFVW